MNWLHYPIDRNCFERAVHYAQASTEEDKRTVFAFLSQKRE